MPGRSASESGDRRWKASIVALAWVGLIGCSATRDLDQDGPVYDEDVEPILLAGCSECHSGDAPEAGWSVDRYIDVVACVRDNVPAVLPKDATAPILAALDREDHAMFVTAAERGVIRDWILAGAPARHGGAHPPGMADPRSGDFHGRILRDSHWEQMLDPEARGACGGCHLGAPSTPSTLRNPPRAATPCTDCHREEDGPLACGTCHGDGARSFPPRSPCFFPGDEADPTHVAHVEGRAGFTKGLACGLCHHPEPTAADLVDGTHGDGNIDIAFDPSIDGTYADGSCSVACHSRGGTMPSITWGETVVLDCGSCHQTPPADHYSGACSTCHPGVNSDGTAFDSVELHVNGEVNLGGGGSGCAACHGSGDDPWPLTGAHQAHREPGISGAVDCESCHVVPDDLEAAGHLDSSPGAEVRLGGLAVTGGVPAIWNGVGCADVACHGAGLDSAVGATPRWLDETGQFAECGSCHAVPPAAPHTDVSTCNASGCHGDEIALTPMGPAINAAGRDRHINGMLDHGSL